MKDMKNKIIWYLLYLVIWIGLILSADVMYEDYTSKTNQRFDALEKEVQRQWINDEEFLKNADYYKNILDKIYSESKLTNEYIKELKNKGITLYN